MTPDDPLSPETLNTLLNSTSRETLEERLSKANERLLMDDVYRRQVCLHEAGHIIYGYRMNMNSYEVRLPEILVAPDGRPFVTGAATLPLDQAKCARQENFEFCYARFNAAGGAVAEKLSGISSWEGVCAAGDFCLFIDFMRERGIEDKVKSYWTQAVQDVREDLRMSEPHAPSSLHGRIKKMAGEVSDKLLTQAGVFTENRGGRSMIKVKLSAGESAILTESGSRPAILINFCPYSPMDLIDGESPFLDEPRGWNNIERVRKWNSMVDEAVAIRKDRSKKKWTFGVTLPNSRRGPQAQKRWCYWCSLAMAAKDPLSRKIFLGHAFFTRPELRNPEVSTLYVWPTACEHSSRMGRRAEDPFRGLRAGPTRSSPDRFRRLPQKTTPNGHYQSAEVRPRSCDGVFDPVMQWACH